MEQGYTLIETADGSSTVWDPAAGQSYKSSRAAATESRAVFLAPVLFEATLPMSRPFRILELGFGLGTNFRTLLGVLPEIRASGAQGVEFVSIERELAGAKFLLASCTEFSGRAALESMLAESAYSDPTGFLNARLLSGDFQMVLASLAAAGEKFDGIFFDPFSPAANPDSWTEACFRLCAAVAAPGARLGTYSVSRAAKDGLAAAGWQWEKRPLPEILHKRNALLAIKIH